MNVIASSVFCILRFSHQENIIVFDQIDYITPDIHNFAANNVHFLGQSSIESVGVGILKDSSLMGIFPLPSPTTPHVSMINIIWTQVQHSLESLDHLVVPGPYDHSSLLLSILLKMK